MFDSLMDARRIVVGKGLIVSLERHSDYDTDFVRPGQVYA